MPVGYYIVLLFLVYLFLKDFSKTNYPKIYQTNPKVICRVGRIMAVDDQSEISLSIPRWTLPWQPIFVGFIPQNMYFCCFFPTKMIRRIQAASGAAGWANSGLCPASSHFQ